MVDVVRVWWLVKWIVVIVVLVIEYEIKDFGLVGVIIIDVKVIVDLYDVMVYYMVMGCMLYDELNCVGVVVVLEWVKGVLCIKVGVGIGVWFIFILMFMFDMILDSVYWMDELLVCVCVVDVDLVWVWVGVKLVGEVDLYCDNGLVV